MLSIKQPDLFLLDWTGRSGSFKWFNKPYLKIQKIWSIKRDKLIALWRPNRQAKIFYVLFIIQFHFILSKKVNNENSALRKLNFSQTGTTAAASISYLSM